MVYEIMHLQEEDKVNTYNSFRNFLELSGPLSTKFEKQRKKQTMRINRSAVLRPSKFSVYAIFYPTVPNSGHYFKILCLQYRKYC